jgi:hypothetical protein
MFSAPDNLPRYRLASSIPSAPLDRLKDGFRPNADESSQPLATSLQPSTSATLTIRIIKSFEFRTQKGLVLKGLDLGALTVGGLMVKCREGLFISYEHTAERFGLGVVRILMVSRGSEAGRGDGLCIRSESVKGRDVFCAEQQSVKRCLGEDRKGEVHRSGG